MKDSPWVKILEKLIVVMMLCVECLVNMRGGKDIARSRG
jgi:hypothetical protein